MSSSEMLVNSFFHVLRAHSEEIETGYQNTRTLHPQAYRRFLNGLSLARKLKSLEVHHC